MASVIPAEPEVASLNLGLVACRYFVSFLAI
jgi:hypothetical protein